MLQGNDWSIGAGRPPRLLLGSVSHIGIGLIDLHVLIRVSLLRAVVHVRGCGGILFWYLLCYRYVYIYAMRCIDVRLDICISHTLVYIYISKYTNM